MATTFYGSAIREAFEYLLDNRPEVFAIGQGLWSSWYVGNTMTGLEEQFGKAPIIDTPVSEMATTGAALGAALCGYRPVVVHPRVGFMLLAVDQLVTQAAKWRHMFGEEVDVPITVRAIINRGGEQGAQHSQALHSWFAHIPGLRVVMPASARDARDLLIASVLCDDPVLYIDDRWLYGVEDEVGSPVELDLAREGPRLVRSGEDLTLIGAGHSAWLCAEAAKSLAEDGVHCDVIDVTVLNPFDSSLLLESVGRTGRLLAVDGDWSTCGFASEMIARAAESLPTDRFRASPRRLTLRDAPAPTSSSLESNYYTKVSDVVSTARQLVGVRGESWE
jgi:acetoin:2,6-dichlorophenolindophenol oxidoreductase subunit beta